MRNDIKFYRMLPLGGRDRRNAPRNGRGASGIAGTCYGLKRWRIGYCYRYHRSS
jgi:hypothetical protein